MNKQQISFDQIIASFGSSAVLAKELGLKDECPVHKWRQRNSIPSEYWKDLLSAAKRRKVRLTAYQLIDAAAARRAA